MMKTKNKKSYRDEMADFFIKGLEEDPIKFIRGWDFSKTGNPVNYSKNKEYNGINKLYLKLLEVKLGYGDNRWLTFNQLKEKDLHLQKGAKGAKVEYYIPYDNEKKKWAKWDEFNLGATYIDENGMICDKYSLRQRLFTVFNASQIDGIEKLPVDYTKNKIDQEKVIERISNKMGVKIIERRNSQSAFYDPNDDEIILPEREQFKSRGDYIRTSLHELGHSTGHSTRLNRDLSGKFGSRKYAFEELVAEITSSFMGEYVSEPITESVLENHKAYIQSWAKEIKNNKNFLFKAIKEAETASNYIIEHAQLFDFKRDFEKENKKPVFSWSQNDEEVEF